ncbi:hypothetical protein BV25DRAFT_1843338 [Artomyces pyxidatus]|uniref:Uncharacterized protein n=1 Tax=Artomyces pyxidatus TaxID=48021 RepID=A0ACB8SEH4_9AGAM|nr:hypothetical protein BV25DRAFT_1843338 [Artomyces pyxidatus]
MSSEMDDIFASLDALLAAHADKLSISVDTLIRRYQSSRELREFDFVAMYSFYFAEHEEEERARLQVVETGVLAGKSCGQLRSVRQAYSATSDAPTGSAVGGTTDTTSGTESTKAGPVPELLPSPDTTATIEREREITASDKETVVKKCFDAFKEAHGEEWKTTLFRATMRPEDVEGRALLFHKKIGLREAFATSDAVAHRFETLAICAGGFVGDQLCQVFATEGAKGFLHGRLGISEATLKEHFRAHVYSNQRSNHHSQNDVQRLQQGLPQPFRFMSDSKGTTMHRTLNMESAAEVPQAKGGDKSSTGEGEGGKSKREQQERAKTSSGGEKEPESPSEGEGRESKGQQTGSPILTRAATAKALAVENKRPRSLTPTAGSRRRTKRARPTSAPLLSTVKSSVGPKKSDVGKDGSRTQEVFVQIKHVRKRDSVKPLKSGSPSVIESSDDDEPAAPKAKKAKILQEDVDGGLSGHPSKAEGSGHGGITENLSVQKADPSQKSRTIPSHQGSPTKTQGDAKTAQKAASHRASPYSERPYDSVIQQTEAGPSRRGPSFPSGLPNSEQLSDDPYDEDQRSRDNGHQEPAKVRLPRGRFAPFYAPAPRAPRGQGFAPDRYGSHGLHRDRFQYGFERPVYGMEQVPFPPIRPQGGPSLPPPHWNPVHQEYNPQQFSAFSQSQFPVFPPHPYQNTAYSAYQGPWMGESFEYHPETEDPLDLGPEMPYYEGQNRHLARSRRNHFVPDQRDDEVDKTASRTESHPRDKT